MSSPLDDDASINAAGRESAVIRLSDYRRRKAGRVFFSRQELSQLLSLYSVWVARGEWRDYALDHATGIAVFSVFRHTHDRALYSIAKIPQPKGVEFSLFDGRHRLARSADLSQVLDPLRAPPLRLLKE